MPRSSFHGRLHEIRGIAIDNFEGDCLESRAFFLSHCHTDHTQGLFSEELLYVVSTHKVHIYMSELTAAIVLNDEKSVNMREKLKECIKVLKLGSTDIKLPALLGFGEEYVNVTTLPAGHCLGSVMFLFRTNEKSILYTGDFRISTSDVKKLQYLHDKNGEPIKLDALYVDTTFIDKRYSEFPKRNHCIEELSKIITKRLKLESNNRVAWSLSAKYGYEYLFEEISKVLNTKIYINDNNRLNVYMQHPVLRDIFTDKVSESKHHICVYNNIKSHQRCGMIHDTELNYLLIRVSAMKWGEYDLESSAIEIESENKISICFPTHCSRNEVIYFINYLSPKRIIGFPNEYLDDISYDGVFSAPINNKPLYFKEVTKKIVSPVHLKQVQHDRKVDQKVIRKLFDPII